MEAQILACLPPDFPWAGSLHCFDTVTSTNDLAKTMARQGAPHGTALVAKCQTGGRGRMGRSFQSPAGLGVYLSVILRPRCPADALMHLTCAVGVAMCNAVEHTAGFRPGIKWINDLVFRGKKLGGILTELVLSSDTVDAAIVGIGINCRQQPGDFPPELRDIAASLEMVTGNPVAPGRLAAEMLLSLYEMDQGLFSGKAPVMAQYRRDCVTLGRQVCVLGSGQSRNGRALDVDDSGALLVEFAPGDIQAVNSGEVSVKIQ